MGIFKKIFGICETKPPVDNSAWSVVGNAVTLDLGRLPELAKAGGAVRLEGNGLSARIFVMKGDNGEFYVYENRCTHMGRRLDPGERDGTVKCCSVSGSVFDLNGNPVGGAAKKPVTMFPVSLDGNQLRISLR